MDTHCIRLGFTKHLVLPLPEPPMTSTFLFRAVLGSLGRLFMVRRSVWVRRMLLSNTGSIYGAISLGPPHRALPYSTPLRYFLAFLLFTYTIRRNATAPATPTARSNRRKLGETLSKAKEKPSARCKNFSDKSAPAASR